VFTESLLRNGFGYPYYNMDMFYLVHNKPLSSQYVLFIYSDKVKYPRIERLLEIIDSFECHVNTQPVSGQDLNRRPPEYRARMLTNIRRLSVECSILTLLSDVRKPSDVYTALVS
jgi:hypothetical protein